MKGKGKRMEPRDPVSPHVVIVGGGFGGLQAAQALRHAPVRVTLLDRRNFHLFQPLLYQVATGGLSPGDIAAPLRAVFKRQQNVAVLNAEVVDIRPQDRRLVLRDGELGYDLLVLACGSTHHYFGHDEWALRAPGLKTVEDALEIRRRVFLAFETAEREEDERRRRAWMRFVVVGGGPTGVELAGALAELARTTLAGDFRRIDPRKAEILLIEGSDRVLPPYLPELSARAVEALQRLDVEVRTSARVTGVEEGVAMVQQGERTERIEVETVLWAAGMKASGLGEALVRATGAEQDRSGRLVVGPDLTLPGHPEIFVIGDMAHFSHQGDKPLPAVAPVAVQQGEYVARTIVLRLEEEKVFPFRYRDKGSMAVIGRNAAVADLGFMHFSGRPAWLVWIFAHIVNLVGFQSKLLVMIQWAWNYFTRNRGARLITGTDIQPHISGKG